MVECNVLGPVTVAVDGQSAPPELLWKKNLALLVYLARSPGPRSREHLCGLLWGEKPESSARHSLNEALRILRRVLGEDLVQSDGQQVALAAGSVQLDTSRFEAATAREAWEEASRLVRGPFLEGFGVPDSSGFEDWIAVERRYWLQQSVLALSAHAELCATQGDIAGAARVAGRAVALDPLSDAAHRAAIRATALAGERAAALGQYDEFAGRLRELLGAEPQPETMRLADRVRRERSWQLPEILAGAEKEARRAPLVGREQALAEAMAAWESSRREKKPAVVALEGEPGIGKTRLAEEIASRARLDGAVVLGIRCVPSDLDAPWSGVARPVRGRDRRCCTRPAGTRVRRRGSRRGGRAAAATVRGRCRVA